eukprot:TRINITY_DN9841_c0_g1_i2.p1 TRINITY_DN9841_c0_g1~~TRINITY_DN9841_c0_g1_i2.p1  ORF type:complete len:786 (+),score=171.57 TRINITY_DN9841_c0_g1_i2:172-2529(+)
MAEIASHEAKLPGSLDEDAVKPVDSTPASPSTLHGTEKEERDGEKKQLEEHLPDAEDEFFNEVEEENDAFEYPLEESIWETAFMMFLRFENGETPWGAVDKIIMAMTVFVNLAVQALFVAIIERDMLDNPYTSDNILTMLQWRANEGHRDKHVDPSGTTLIQRLCSQSLWSHEQDEYDQMADYLNKPMHGKVLSGLAMVLWIICVMKEYARVVDMSTAVWSLKTITNDEAGVMKIKNAEGDERFNVVGISVQSRFLCMFFVVLPRAMIALSLAIWGSQYLAETVDLGDIILNSMALAFVMDIDEMLYNVFATHRLKKASQKWEAIPCGNRRRLPGDLYLVDLIRYIMTVLVVVLCIVGFLLPFEDHVKAAEQALCGGDMDFYWMNGAWSTDAQGGHEGYSHVIIQANEKAPQSCGTPGLPGQAGKTLAAKMEQEAAAKSSAQNQANNQIGRVLQHAFRDEKKSKLRVRASGWTAPSDTLVDVIKNTGEYTFSRHAVLPFCKGFEPSKGLGNCPALENASFDPTEYVSEQNTQLQNAEVKDGACLWPKSRFECEDNTMPGEVLWYACDIDSEHQPLPWYLYGQRNAVKQKFCKAKEPEPDDAANDTDSNATSSGNGSSSGGGGGGSPRRLQEEPKPPKDTCPDETLRTLCPELCEPDMESDYDGDSWEPKALPSLAGDDDEEDRRRLSGGRGAVRTESQSFSRLLGGQRHRRGRPEATLSRYAQEVDSLRAELASVKLEAEEAMQRERLRSTSLEGEVAALKQQMAAVLATLQQQSMPTPGRGMDI